MQETKFKGEKARDKINRNGVRMIANKEIKGRVVEEMIYVIL